MTTGMDRTPSRGGGDAVGTASPRNVQRRVALLSRYLDLRGMRILDVGCGYGKWVMKFSEFSSEVYGLEPGSDEVRAFERTNRSSGRVLQGVSERMPFADSSFDLVFLNEVIEHVADEGKTLQEVHRVLRQSGTLAVFCPNRLYPFETHGVRKGDGRLTKPYVPFIPYLPIAIGRRLFTYTARNYFPWEIRALLRRNGFVIEASGYLWQTFENISGVSPMAIRKLAPLLRVISFLLEKIPLVSAFGVSQMYICKKRSSRMVAPS